MTAGGLLLQAAAEAGYYGQSATSNWPTIC